MNIDKEKAQQDIDTLLMLENAYRPFTKNDDSLQRITSLVASYLQKQNVPIDIDIIQACINLDNVKE